MNNQQYTYLIQHPESIADIQTNELAKILDEFPYFQSARAIYLKGLYKQNSFKYNQALKITAAYTCDRNVLFAFITQPSYLEAQNQITDTEQTNTSPQTEEILLNPTKTNTLENSIRSLITQPSSTTQPEVITPQETQPIVANNTIPKSVITTTQNTNTVNTTIEKKLEIGKPLQFNASETYSFQEWLQIAKQTPIKRITDQEEEKEEEEHKNNTPNTINALESKLEIIDKFIEANPKIAPIKSDTSVPNIVVKNQDTSYLMTETLAKIYLEQKKYQKAIQAYQILILKYPEKSSLFADRILDIKSLQQNNFK